MSSHTKTKIAVIGSSGLLGSNLLQLYKEYDVKGFSRAKDNIVDFNNLNAELHKYFSNWVPDIVINALALTNLQECEQDYDKAKKINTLMAQELALIAKKYHSYYIHVSTDHYFQDSKLLHSERDVVCLKNNYAKTKYEAEKLVLEAYPSSLVVRTNIVGFRKNNIPSFFEWLLYSLKNSEPIKLFDDYFSSPISVRLLGSLLLKCYDKKLLGIYNISASEVVDKYTFAKAVAQKFMCNLDHTKKCSIHSIQMGDDIQRATTLGLNVSKIERSLGLKMPRVEETLNQLHREYMEMHDE